MNVQEFYNALCQLYPTSLSCQWDNDGLMCAADLSAPVRRVLVSLDPSLAALHYAAENRFDLLLTHHPMLFRPCKQVTSETLSGKRILTALQSGIAVISLHTRADIGEGGVNDCLAAKLDLKDMISFGDAESPTLGRIGTVKPQSGSDFAKFVKKRLQAPYVNAYLCRDVQRVAVVGGSGKDFVLPALAAGADTIVTGECGYNAALDAAELGINVLEAGHFYTENPVCDHFAALAAELSGAKVEIFSPDPAVTY